MSLSPMEQFQRRITPLRKNLASRAKLLRGVPESELAQRFSKAQDLMQEQNIDCIVLTTEPDIFYFTGFKSRFWASPTRPFFLIIPPRPYTRPIAVINILYDKTLRLQNEGAASGSNFDARV